MSLAIPILSELIFKYLQGELTVEESLTLQKWKEESNDNLALFEALTNKAAIDEGLIAYNEASESRIRLKQKLEFTLFHKSQPLTVDLEHTDTFSSDLKPVSRRIHLLKTAWFRYAAAILFLFGAAAYLWKITLQEKPSVTQISPTVPEKISGAPGGNKAILTLGDGSIIVLDSLENGPLMQQGASTIQKIADGQIIYKAGSAPVSQAVVYNTMTTPRGGQYSLRLPDGSTAWLNAASSITYPTFFTGKTRSVSITGEAYFEITKNASVPFIVKTSKDSITVLGTSFNVNSYSNEIANKVSLLEGSVIVNNKTLKPGQAYVDGRIVDTNVERDVAWKNGFFNFEDAGLTEVMHQLERWYDIEVSYEGPAPDIKFKGSMDRGLTLSQVLKGLSRMEVNFRIEGRKLIVGRLTNGQSK